MTVPYQILELLQAASPQTLDRIGECLEEPRCFGEPDTTYRQRLLRVVERRFDLHDQWVADIMHGTVS